MFRPRRQRLRPRFRGLSINTMIPNILTVLALCAGLTAVRFAFQEKWEFAVYAILLAAIFDGLDGRVARLLRGTSKFGAELDSLSDFISFGVAPALILFFWTMHDAGALGWAISLLYSVCCALRLARFNTALEKPETPGWAYNFFVGVPAPAGAGLALLPMMMTFQFGTDVFRLPAVTGAGMVIVAFLMVSTIPTFSFKTVRVPAPYVLPSMLLVGLLAAFLVTEPWATFIIIGVLYLGSIVFSVRQYRRLKQEAARLHQMHHVEAEDSGSSSSAPTAP